MFAILARMLRAAIFDMDGLLIDSEPFWRRSHREVVAGYGHTITEDDVRAMAGRRTDEVVKHWHERFNIVGSPHATGEAIMGKVVAHIHVDGAALPGVYDILELCKQHDIPTAVASSSAPQIIDAVLDKLGIARAFTLTYSAIHEEFGKPHPAVFLTTARKLGVEPADCVVFEDSLNGVRAAKAAGMKCIAVPEAVNRSKSEYDAEADVVVDSLEHVSWQAITDLF